MMGKGKKDRVSIHGSVMALVVVVVISEERILPSTSKSGHVVMTKRER